VHDQDRRDHQRAVHYDGARDAPTVVEIRGMGPVDTTYLEAQ
jgi:hypothetical protein